MLIDIIKYYSLFFGCIYIGLKTIRPNKTTKYEQLCSVFFSLFLAFIAYLFYLHVNELTYLMPLLLMIFTLSVISSQPKHAFITISISFAINYCLYALICFIMALFLYQFYKTPSTFPHIILTSISALIQIVIIIKLLSIKRFKKGVPFLLNTKFLNIATILCLFLIGFTAYILPKGTTYNDHFIILMIFLASFAFLIHWWQAQITKSYKQALLNRELESLRTELQEKDKLLNELSTQNEELGRLIHKDNKRIPAMEHAVCEYLVTDFSDKEAAIEKGNSLLLEIKELSQERNNTITEIYASRYKHHNTGIATLDTMLNYMEKRASGEHIKLSVNIALDLNNFIPKNISAEDLTHILSDLLENAIIATKNSPTPTIQLQFYESEKQFVIEIADNGIPFETSSLVNFGLTQLTTHADTGGSGIGLMDIWKTKEKYGASLHIAEYDSDAPYTKKIALIFNKKNRYTISSHRKDELIQESKRTDLQIF